MDGFRQLRKEGNLITDKYCILIPDLLYYIRNSLMNFIIPV